MNELLNQILQNPSATALVLLNLVIIESLLSVDNAAVLATMVMDLPIEQRNKALKYGIFGAFFFRGLAMILSSYLIKIWWLQPLGGLYLLYLVFDWWKTKQGPDSDEKAIEKHHNWLYKLTLGSLGHFWATVCLVELMDMAFSIDNVFAAVALTPNIILVCTGVFIGILAMRFIAQWFVKLMEKFAFLETSAFIVIAILGVKLMLSIVVKLRPEIPVSKFLESHNANLIMSAITISVFFVPILTALFFNFPKKSVSE
jgi:YkoY family integral membrane protein